MVELAAPTEAKVDDHIREFQLGEYLAEAQAMKRNRGNNDVHRRTYVEIAEESLDLTTIDASLHGTSHEMRQRVCGGGGRSGGTRCKLDCLSQQWMREPCWIQNARKRTHRMPSQAERRTLLYELVNKYYSKNLLDGKAQFRFQIEGNQVCKGAFAYVRFYCY